MDSSLADLAESYLSAKALTAASDPRNSDRARRGDLCRLARALRVVTSADAPPPTDQRFDLHEDLALVTLDALDTESLAAALGLLRRTHAPATVARTLATTRGFCRWLVRRGYLAADPTDDELLRSRAPEGNRAQVVESRALDPAAVDALRVAAHSPPPSVRSAWPARDVAVVEVLAGCGLRAAELCGLEVRDYVTDRERPLLQVATGAKGGKGRTVPLPRRGEVAIESYLVERQIRSDRTGAPAPAPTDRLFVRNDTRPFDVSFLDRLVRRLATSAGVALPRDAAAHAFRHQLGVQLALRRTQVPVIQRVLGHADPRTTSVYTDIAAHDLVDALDDAGWL